MAQLVLRCGQLFVFLLFMSSSVLVADQVIIDSDPNSPVLISDDVECSVCDASALSASAIELLTGGSGGEVTAGQLWSFLKAQGVDSMDELTLNLDIDPNYAPTSENGSSVDISSLQLQIENPDGTQGFATDVRIGDKQVFLPSLSQNADSADMQLAVKLHYDFMERFSADSTEKIKLNVSTGAGLMPSISISKKAEELRSLNWPLLIAFSAFWVGIFALVNWFTNPKMINNGTSQESALGATNNPVVST